MFHARGGLSSLAIYALPAKGEAPRGVALDDEEADLVRPEALGVALAVAAPQRLDAAARLQVVVNVNVNVNS